MKTSTATAWKIAFVAIIVSIITLENVDAFTCKASISIGNTVKPSTDENCTDSARINMCFVSIAGQVDNHIIRRGCQLSGISVDDICGSSITSMRDGSIAKTCCCTTPSCNNDEFLEKCKEGTVEVPTIDAFACHRETKNQETVITHAYHNCGANSTTGQSYHNRCMIRIITDGQKASLSSGCLTTSTSEFPCGSKTQLGSIITQQCCCDTKMCNNDSFVQKCVEEALLAPPPTEPEATATPDSTDQTSSFSCVLSAQTDSLTIENGTQNCKANGKGDMCFISISSALDTTRITRGCQDTLANVNDICNITIRSEDGSYTKSCCCDSPSCNNEEFLEKCKNGMLHIPDDSFTCHHGIESSFGRSISYVYQDCEANTTLGPSYQKKCMVSITKDGDQSSISSGCLSKDIPAAACGQSFQNGGTHIHQCCCDSKMCNDEAFLSKCKAGDLTVPFVVDRNTTDNKTSSFKCIASSEIGLTFSTRGVEDCELAGKDSACQVNFIKTQNENNTIVSRSCLVIGTIRSETCGVSITNSDGSVTRSCCCDTTSCNDDAFMEQCMNGTAPNSETEVDSFGCHREIATDTSSIKYNFQDCEVNNTATGQSFANRCMVSLVLNNDKVSYTSSCLPNGIWAPTCGLKVTDKNSTVQQCCCEGKMCNDEEFVKKCKEDAMKDAVQADETFQCHQIERENGETFLEDVQHCKLNGLLEQCMTQVTYFNGTKAVISDCLNRDRENRCGTVDKRNDGFTSVYCCCDSHLCNDEEYIKNCGGNITLVQTNVAATEGTTFSGDASSGGGANNGKTIAAGSLITTMGIAFLVNVLILML